MTKSSGNSHITVAICTYNRSAYLRDTLACLGIQQTDLAKFDVLVVNNNCTDDTDDIIKQAQADYPALQLGSVQEKQQGLSHARNRALNDSRGEYVLFIDDDVYIEDDFIESWTQFVESGKVDAAGGPISVHFDDGKPRWFPMILAQMLGRHKAQKPHYVYPKGAFPHGGNMIFKRDIALAIGFNTSIGRTGNQLSAGEEKDFFRRLQSRKVTIRHNPDASLKHRIGGERLTKDYFVRQARGIGHGDAHSGVSSFIWYPTQLAKLVASCIISAGYLLKLQKDKAQMLIRFRIEVIRGFRTAKSGETTATDNPSLA
ncbi:MAG: glycosyltransferase [Balneolales bacterium]|nr:glycosyltransferase [Balneolales bacterium]